MKPLFYPHMYSFLSTSPNPYRLLTDTRFKLAKDRAFEKLNGVLNYSSVSRCDWGHPSSPFPFLHFQLWQLVDLMHIALFLCVLRQFCFWYCAHELCVHAYVVVFVMVTDKLQGTAVPKVSPVTVHACDTCKRTYHKDYIITSRELAVHIFNHTHINGYAGFCPAERMAVDNMDDGRTTVKSKV